MNLRLNSHIPIKYSSNSQIARILTEGWVSTNAYCPACGEPALESFENNKPAADFYCKKCREQYELKSKSSKNIGRKIVDGSYEALITRIESESNPNFFFLTYNKSELKINNFIIIPKHYFVPGIIEKRKPLSATAKRAGWVGCNINLTRIPDTGRIYLVKDSKVLSKEKVLSKFKATKFLQSKRVDSKSWIIDILQCVESIESEIFLLKDIYVFEDELKVRHPNNRFIKDKIRQQLQVLRDNGLIEFLGRGSYRKVVK